MRLISQNGYNFVFYLHAITSHSLRTLRGTWYEKSLDLLENKVLLTQGPVYMYTKPQALT